MSRCGEENPRGGPRGRAALVAAGALVAALAGDARAESPELPRVTYDIELQAFSRPLPTKTLFILEIPVADTGFDEVELTYWKAADPDEECSAPKAGEKKIGARQRVDGEKKRFDVTILPLTHSAKYCFKLAFSRPLGDKDRTRLRKLLANLVAKALGAQGLDQPGIVSDVDAVFSDYQRYTTIDGKPLLGQLKAWLVEDEVTELRRKTGEARQQAIDGIRNASARCTGSQKLTDIPDLALKPKLSAEARKKAEEIKASVAKLKEARAALVWCPALPDPKEPFPAPSPEAVKAGSALGAFAASGRKLVEGLCDAKLAQAPFQNTQAVCDALGPYVDTASLLHDDIDQVKQKAAAARQGSDALGVAFEQRFGRVRLEALPGNGNTLVPSYAERAGLYISGDVGFMLPYFPGAGEVGFAPMVGANFYFGPVDKDEPLPFDEWALRKRLALTGGIALNVKDSAGTTKGLVGDTSPFVGGGARVTDYLRLGVGAVFVLQKDRNPLETGEAIRLLPYFSASVDIDVAGTLKDIYTTKARPTL